MRIAVASGKGGTGKTTVAVNLAVVARELINDVQYVDCDVEEPDGHLFLKPQIKRTTPAVVMVPVIDEARCDLCGRCAEACRFNALLVTKKNVLVFPELCHGCGACMIVCPYGAIKESTREIGVIETGSAVVGKNGFFNRRIDYRAGVLNVGEHMATPLVRSVKEKTVGKRISIIDASPGTSCPVIEAVRDCDFVVLVTEPTPFGLSDLTLAVGMTKSLGIPMGIIINRSQGIDDELMDYLAAENLTVIGEIPLKREIAEMISRGEIVVMKDESMKVLFGQIFKTINDQRGK
jgi:MinD superfamily P-loop ATPase